MSGPRTLLALAMGAFGAGLAALATLQHRAFATGRFDVGNLTQAVWATANGDFLQVTDLQGRQISRLGAHFDPIVAAFAPFWWLWPDPALLLVAQAVGVSLGAVPVFLLARKHLGSEWAGTGFALVYLLYPPTQWLTLDDFHPVAFATPLLLAAIWFLDERRLLPFTLVAALALSTKEQVGLAVAALGVWYGIAHGRRVAGAGIAGAGVAVAVLALTVVVPHYAPAGDSPFQGRYRAVGGSPLGIVQTTALHPVRVAEAALQGRDLAYLRDLLLPLLGLPLLAPLLASTAIPELAVNALSSTPAQTSIQFHYTAAAIPGLVVAAVFGAARLQRRAPRSLPALVQLAVVAVILAGAVLGPLPIWKGVVPFAESRGARDHVTSAGDAVRRRALALIPPGAAVSATNNLGAHLSARRRIFSFPILRESRWIAVDGRAPSYLDRAEAPRAFARAFARVRRDPAWRVVFSEDRVVVLRRRSSGP